MEAPLDVWDPNGDVKVSPMLSNEPGDARFTLRPINMKYLATSKYLGVYIQLMNDGGMNESLVQMNAKY